MIAQADTTAGGVEDVPGVRIRRLREPGGPRIVGLGAMLAAAVGITVLSGGGFEASSRSAFVALAGATLLTAATVDGAAAARAARSPLALSIAALAVLSIASLAWTVGTPVASVRWGLAIGGYGAIFVAAATLTRTVGPGPLAAGVGGLALIEAILGLRAVAFHALPEAEWLGGVWRPGGTFQYPPALAILQVGALPVLSSSLRCNSKLIAGVAAAATTLDGAVLGLSGSRLAIGLAAALLTILILRPHAGRSQRRAAIATTALVAFGALIGPAVLGAHVGPTAPAAGAAGMVEILGLAAASGLAWPLARRAGALGDAVAVVPAVCLAAVALAVLALTGGYGARRSHARLALSRPTPVSRVAAPSQPDLLHGRGHEWEAALSTWFDRPLLGAGAETYYTASLARQGPAPTRYAHDLPLELAAELGVLGLSLGLALYAASAWTIARATDSRALWLLAPIVVVFLASNLVDWTWHLAGLGALWAAAAGTLEGSRRDSRG